MKTLTAARPNPLLTVEQVRELLNYQHPGSIRRLYQRGILPGIKLNSRVLRFRQEDVEAYISGGATRTAQAGS